VQVAVEALRVLAGRFARWWNRRWRRLVLVHPQRVKAIASAK